MEFADKCAEGALVAKRSTGYGHNRRPKQQYHQIETQWNKSCGIVSIADLILNSYSKSFAIKTSNKGNHVT